jgi:DNA-binding PadR family transcriptional regulator
VSGSIRLNATAASLLGFLHAGPMSGWDLLTIADLVIGDFWSLARSQVYRELDAMAKAGLVEAGPPGRRDRRAYDLTAAGRAAFAEWIASEPGPESIRFPLLLTVSFGRHLAPEVLERFLVTHRATHEERLKRYGEQQEAAVASGSPDPFAMASLEFGLIYERGVLEWFERLNDLLASANGYAEAPEAGGEGDEPLGS